MDYPFIIRYKQGKYLQTKAVRSSFREITKAKGRALGGLFQEVVHAGWDKQQLSIRTAAGELDRGYCVRADGSSTTTRWGATVPATAAGVKTAVRRIRPGEAEEVDAVDRKIANHFEAIKLLRVERSQLVAKAWTKGHVVHLNEVLPTEGTSRLL